MQVKVEVAGDIPQLVELTNFIKIGSGEDMDIIIPSQDSFHGLLSVNLDDPTKLVITDPNSEGGVLIDGKTLPVRTPILFDPSQSEVRFGKVPVRFTILNSVEGVDELNIDPILGQEFLQIGAFLTKNAYEERTLDSIKEGKVFATIFRVPKSKLEHYKEKVANRGLRAATITVEDSPVLDLLIYRDGMVKTLVESWEGIKNLGNLHSSWFLAELFDWPKHFITDLLNAAERRDRGKE